MTIEPFLTPGLYRRGRALFTENLRPGEKVYGEELVSEEGREYRLFDPWRSKLAAYLTQGGRQWPYGRVRSVLYLGGGHGTTVSHLSDVLPKGSVHVVEKAPRSFGALLALCEKRENLLPILGDVQMPERYRADCGEVDHLYQDVSQRGQVEILLENARACLKPHGTVFLMLKTRSVTQRRPAAAVVAETRAALTRAGWRVVDQRTLTPFSRDHVALVVQRT